MWVATDDGLYRIEDEAPVPFAPGDGLNLTALLVDRNGNLWMATRASGVLRYDGKDQTRFVLQADPGLDGLADNRAYALYEDGMGRVWAGTLSGASVYDGTAWKSYAAAEGLVDKRVTCFAEDQEGRLWIGTQGGASRFDGERLENFTVENGLVSDYVSAISQDNDRRGNARHPGGRELRTGPGKTPQRLPTSRPSIRAPFLVAD